MLKPVLVAVALFAAICPSMAGDGTASSVCSSNPDYNTYFTGEKLRIDIVLAGNRTEQHAYLDKLYREGEWTGNPASLVNRFGYGQYCYEAFAEGTLIYSNSFSTLFEEWRTTPQADAVSMAAGQTLWMPMPKGRIHFVLYERIRATGMFEPFFEMDIDPSDTHIEPLSAGASSAVLLKSGDNASKVDLTFAAEGYTASEMEKFRSDARRFMDYLFTMEPYASRKDDFNVRLVENVSEESGVDIPQWGQWRVTAMDSGFDTFYEDRYLTIMDHRKIADAVAGVPTDVIMVIANEKKYGGGGIYNSYAMGTSDHQLSEIVFVHEFGHSFAGLGDEYYDSSVAYEDYYPADVEPWEPNITTQVDFASKWKDMMGQDGVGLFEGAGYQAKGCWRPYPECRMLNNTAPGFCPVCQRAISAMIDYYTGGDSK